MLQDRDTVNTTINRKSLSGTGFDNPLKDTAVTAYYRVMNSSLDITICTLPTCKIWSRPFYL